MNKHNGKPLLVIEDLFLNISGSNILNGINFSIASGSTVGLIGPNGSGKTTLFNCISGFNVPQKGTFYFIGQNITRKKPFARAKLGLARVFQNFGVFRDMTVLENMLVALETQQPWWHTFSPWSKTTIENKARALDFLAMVKLDGKAKEKASSLSGGQMRLLEMVRALAFGAHLFLLDEPTAGVAPKLKQDVADLISKLQELGKTVLIIEHDINFIQSFCDRILVLNEGRIILDGSPTTVRSSPELQEIYFGDNAKTGVEQTNTSPDINLHK